MRLTFDLRSLQAARGEEPGVRRVTIEDLALMARRPRDARRPALGSALRDRDDRARRLAAQRHPRRRARLGRPCPRRAPRDPYVRWDANAAPGSVYRDRLGSARRAAAARACGERLARAARTAHRVGPVRRAGCCARRHARSRTCALSRRSTTWARYVGGAATHTTGVINGFVQNDVEVTVYATQRPEGLGGSRFTEVPLQAPLQLHPLADALRVLAGARARRRTPSR